MYQADEARMRVDKWLWVARFFKTRSLATEAVNKGRVRINGQLCKPAKEVKVGDGVTVEMPPYQWEVDVHGMAETRGSATVAQALYAETEASRVAREAEMARRKLYQEPSAPLHGRPTKRSRRDMERLRSGHGSA